MLGLLREAQQQSDLLRQRLLEAEGRAVALLQDNIRLKQQLGLPTEAEQAALAAWTGAALPLAAAAAAPQQQGVPELPAAGEQEGGDAGQGTGSAAARLGTDEEDEEDEEQEEKEGGDAEEAPGSPAGTPAAGEAAAAGQRDGATGVTRRRRSARA